MTGRIWIAAALLAGACGPSPTAGVDVDPAAIARPVPENSCAPASLLSCLRFGAAPLQRIYRQLPGDEATDKIAHLVEEYGGRPSVVDPAKTWFGADRGMFSEDILEMANAVLDAHGAAPLTGEYADRAEGEPLAVHLRRVHAWLVHSLDAGVPPIISVRSFAVQHDADDFRWEGVASHAVLVTRVPRELAPNVRGFTFEFVEPSGATVEEGYVRIEEVRPYSAIRGSGDKDFRWITGSPFLLVEAPVLDMGQAAEEWSARTIVTLNYVIGRLAD